MHSIRFGAKKKKCCCLVIANGKVGLNRFFFKANKQSVLQRMAFSSVKATRIRQNNSPVPTKLWQYGLQAKEEPARIRIFTFGSVAAKALFSIFPLLIQIRIVGLFGGALRSSECCSNSSMCGRLFAFSPTGGSRYTLPFFFFSRQGDMEPRAHLCLDPGHAARESVARIIDQY